MATWGEVMDAAPELAAACRVCFDAHIHKVIATIRRDGSPRVSGVEATFDDKQLWLGMMPESRKALDLQRDPRFALHSATVDPELAAGDVKLSGTAIEVVDAAVVAAFAAAHEDRSGEEPPSPFHLFRADITELVRTSIGVPPDHLVIESWREGVGLRRVERK